MIREKNAVILCVMYGKWVRVIFMVAMLYYIHYVGRDVFEQNHYHQKRSPVQFASRESTIASVSSSMHNCFSSAFCTTHRSKPNHHRHHENNINIIFANSPMGHFYKALQISTNTNEIVIELVGILYKLCLIVEQKTQKLYISCILNIAEFFCDKLAAFSASLVFLVHFKENITFLDQRMKLCFHFIVPLKFL